VKQSATAKAITQYTKDSNLQGHEDNVGNDLQTHEKLRREMFKKHFENYRNAVNALEKTYETKEKASTAKNLAYDYNDLHQASYALKSNYNDSDTQWSVESAVYNTLKQQKIMLEAKVKKVEKRVKELEAKLK